MATQTMVELITDIEQAIVLENAAQSATTIVSDGAGTYSGGQLGGPRRSPLQGSMQMTSMAATIGRTWPSAF